MHTATFKNIIAKIKDDFHERIATTNCKQLPIEEVAQLLFKYLKGEPIAHRDLLLKGTGKRKVTWDNLLQYLQEDLSAQEAVKKIEHRPQSATQIMDRHSNQYLNLVQYVKMKETNSIERIMDVPYQVAGRGIVLTVFDKQVVFYDVTQEQIIGQLSFKYSHVKQKLYEKEEQRKLLKAKESERFAQLDDTVGEIRTESKQDRKNRKQSSRLSNAFTNNVRSSQMGSSFASEKSGRNAFLKRFGTDSGLKKKKRVQSQSIKIRNDDTAQIFSLFRDASLDNSVEIAKVFTEARQNFLKHVEINKDLLTKQKQEQNYEVSLIPMHRDYTKDLNDLKQAYRKLDSMQISRTVSQSPNNRKLRSLSMQKGREAPKGKKSIQMEQTFEIDKLLQIASVSLIENLLLVSLYNREVRLFELKKTISRVEKEILLELTFKDQPTFVHLYRSTHNKQLRMVLTTQKDNAQRESRTEIMVYHFRPSNKQVTKAFTYDLDFCAKAYPSLPLGVSLFDELGHIALIELNNSVEAQQQFNFSKQLTNQQLNCRISTTTLCTHHNNISFFLGCSHGYVYLYDRYLKRIKHQRRGNPSPVVALCLIKGDSELIALYQNGNMSVLSTIHLEQIFIYHSYRDVSCDSKIILGIQDLFYIHNKRKVVPYCMIENEEKKFNNTKPAKVLKSRLKLKQRHRQHVAMTQKAKVLKVFEGQGGKGDFICVAYDHGQLFLFNSLLEYVGSYYFMKVNTIVSVATNESHQFIALYLQDNSIEVINIYNQTTIFTIEQSYQSPKKNLKSNSTPHSKTPQKDTLGYKGAVKHISFMDLETTYFFMSVVTQDLTVHHFSQNGSLLSSSALDEDRVNNWYNMQMIYEGEELVLTNEGGSLLVLHRKSYNRKYILKVAQNAELVSIKKIDSSQPFHFCTIDNKYRVYLVNIHTRKVQEVHPFADTFAYQGRLFTETMMLKFHEDKCRLDLVGQKDQVQLIYYTPEREKIYLINSHVIKINKMWGRILRFNKATADFQQIKF